MVRLTRMETRRLVANWKMNLPPEGIEQFVASLQKAAGGLQLGIAPPFPFLPVLVSAAAHREDLVIGAQNCSDRESGAFTGEVSAGMLTSIGAEFVIVGHSERRHLFGEDSVLVGRKARIAADSGLRPLVCVGEQEQSRENGETEVVLEEQLRGLVEGFGELPANLLLAYEPVWAIGTGKVATPEIASETHASIRAIVERLTSGGTQVSILYGGSVSPDNADALVNAGGIDGFLVGGASLSSSKFNAIAAVFG